MDDKLTGSTRPVLDQHRWRGEKNITLRVLAWPDHWASMFFYLFHNVALFRMFVEALAVAALVATVLGVFLEYKERARDRAVRHAMLRIEISQLRSLPWETRSKLAHVVIEALLEDGVDLSRIELGDLLLKDLNFGGTILVGSIFSNAQISGVNFDNASLQGSQFGNARISKTSFRGADLSGVNFGELINLKKVDFSNADLTSATLSDTRIDGSVRFHDANLKNAYFVRSNLSDANLSTAKGLVPKQFEEACAHPNKIPKLPKSMNWMGESCADK